MIFIESSYGGGKACDIKTPFEFFKKVTGKKSCPFRLKHIFLDFFQRETQNLLNDANQC